MPKPKISVYIDEDLEEPQDPEDIEREHIKSEEKLMLHKNMKKLKTEYQQVITIKNSTERRVDCSVFDGEGRFSTKSDGSRHGYGMKNVKKALQKNGAMMEIGCNDTEFAVNIVIMKFDNGGIK